MSSQQNTPVRNTQRFALGIFLGAMCGAVVASMLLKLPDVRQTIGVYAFDFEVTFGRPIGEHLFTALTFLGALAGAAVGGSLAVSIRWFAVLWTLFAGIVIGGAIMFFVEVKAVKYVSGIWQQGYADERAFSYLECLRAIDRGATNQLYLVRFQNNGRMALTNWNLCKSLETWCLHQASERYANDDQSPAWTFGQPDDRDPDQRLFGTARPDAGLDAAGKGVASDVSGDYGASAMCAAGALQDESAPTLLWIVRSAMRGTGQ